MNESHLLNIIGHMSVYHIEVIIEWLIISMKHLSLLNIIGPMSVYHIESLIGQSFTRRFANLCSKSLPEPIYS